MTDYQPSPHLHVAPTIDFDAVSAVLTATDPDPTWLSYAEFAGRIGAPRLLDFLRDRNWRVTWFVPGQTIEAFPGVCERICEEGHEIAHHGYCHEDPSRLDERDEREMLERGIEAITRLTGRAPRGYKAPFWRSNWRTQDLLIEYGFEYDASLMAGDFLPYWYRTGDAIAEGRGGGITFGVETGLVEIPVSWHLEDGGLYEIPSASGGPLKPPAEVAEIWDADFTFAYEHISGGIVTLTIHPEITGRGGRLASAFALLDEWLVNPNVEIVRLDSFVEAWKSADSCKAEG